MSISWAVIIVSTTFLNNSTSNFPPIFKNLTKFKEARLQALLSKCMYSLQGLEAFILPVFGQVCHSLIVVSYCMPGSALCQAASAIQSINSLAFMVSIVSPVVTPLKSQYPSAWTALINSSLTLTELFAFLYGRRV